MDNRDTAAARHYHDTTSHSPASLHSSTHELDWDNRPIQFKIYETIEPIPLPPDFAPSSSPALRSLANPEPAPDGRQAPGLDTLARLCFFSNGVTRYLTRRGERYPFRAAACTGALYHIEIYLVCGELPGLAAGIYHFSAHDNALRRLRSGDYRAVLVEATGAEPAVTAAPVVAVCTSTFWRNAWKYQARAYRHSFWDNGTMLANLLAVAAAAELPAKVVLGFADDPVNRLLDVDPRREAAVSLVAIGGAYQTPGAAPPMPPLGLPVTPLSAYEVEYPEIATMHRVSSLETGALAAGWRGELPAAAPPAPSGRAVDLQPTEATELPSQPIEEVIRHRGSSRRFARRSIRLDQLSTLLWAAGQDIPADFLGPHGRQLGGMYVIANAVDGLRPGRYVYHTDHARLELLRAGDCRDEAAFLALAQDLGGDAAVNVYFLSDLDPVLERFGNRGYRAAQLEAAIRGGKLYLAAYALGLGATGLTFFDDEVTGFFSPHSAGQSVMFLVAIGHPQRR